ncbi:nucleotidyltransferase domain-containing protein [Paracidobacterium acidisoli]|nr:nucleotidyltransferase family protein [Paracidobacterium acidisoli]MBT9332638.1 nucleotidyltransferase family protein [Paracidobacterium acidisoli]
MSEPETLAEAALLITCLRGQPFTIPSNIDWHTLQALAAENGVLLPVCRSLSEAGAAIPDFFASAARECGVAAEIFSAELESLLKEFAAQGIDALPLKGPVLAESLYGDAAMRQCNDLDLLVRGGDYPRAEALLLRLGFAASSEIDDYHRRFVRNGVPVELHFGIAPSRYFPFDLDGVWRRSAEGTFRGSPMRVMSDDDLVLFLCLHGLKHGFSRLIWILDVARALNRIRTGDYKALIQRARREGQEAWLLIGCEVVREMLPRQLPPGMDAAIAESPRMAERARRVVAQMFAEDPKVINEIRAFYLQTERSARRRWRRRLSYLAPTPMDDQWMERYRISRNLVPVLRPLRVLQKYGISRVWRTLFPPAA